MVERVAGGGIGDAAVSVPPVRWHPQADAFSGDVEGWRKEEKLAGFLEMDSGSSKEETRQESVGSRYGAISLGAAFVGISAEPMAQASIEGLPPWVSLGGISPASARLLRRIRDAACSEDPVLIVGARGTERVSIAMAIHANSERRAASLAVIECSAFANVASLLEALDRWRPPHAGGSLLLDKLESLGSYGNGQPEGWAGRIASWYAGRRKAPAQTKPRLLMSYDCGSACREVALGASSLLVIEVPPLDTRTCDIPVLANQLLLSMASASGKTPKYLAPEALARLMARPWPGNLEELAKVLECAARMTDKAEIGPKEIGAACHEGSQPVHDTLRLGMSRLTRQFNEGVEEHLIAEALLRAGNNRTRAARLLGIGRRTLLYKLKRERLSDAG